MPHCTTNFAWYFGKFLLGFTGMLILYMGFLKDKYDGEYAYPCKPGMRKPLADEKGENDNMCSAGDQRGVNAQKQCGQESKNAHAKNRCSWYANRGKCSQRERCYPRMIAPEYLVKSNNAIDVKMHGCSHTQKHGKLLKLALNPEMRYSYKCRWCNSITGQSCVRKKPNRVRKRIYVRIPFSQDTIADLWNVERVCEGLHCVRSEDNDLSKSFAKKNVNQFQEESTNVEKLAQEETTSSSYVDAKNCFVQDACIQTICEDREETCLERFSNRCEKEDEDNIELPKDTSFTYYEHNETKLKDKREQTSLNCDCELPIVEEPTNNVNVKTSVSLEQVKKSNINEMRSVSNSSTCVPRVPELRLERKCDCHPGFNSEYQFLNENEVESRQKYDEKCQTNRLFDTRNRWNSEITSPSSCESNRYTSNDLQSSTSTESVSPLRAKTKIMCNYRDRGPSIFFNKSIKIGEGPWRRKDVLKNSTSPLIHKSNTKKDYSDQSNQFMCHCDDMGQKMISDDKFEYKETDRSRTSYSSTSLSSYDRDRSPRSFSRCINCRCRNLANVASSASTCTGSLASEIEYRNVKKSSKALNPLSLTSTITYGNNRHGRFNITRFSSQKNIIRDAKKMEGKL